MARKNTDYTNIPKEKFEFFDRSEAIHDKKLETKPVGYFKDAMMRFCRNKSSLTAAVIIALLLAFALIVPLVSHNSYTKSKTDTTSMESCFQSQSCFHGQAGMAQREKQSAAICMHIMRQWRQSAE